MERKSRMRVGYARISTGEQTLDLQLDALRHLGCDQVFHDVVSGAKDERTGLADALGYVRPGDTVTVWKLDRLGRSLKHLIAVMSELQAHGVGFASLTEQIDTTTPGGKLIFHLFGALAEFERDLIREVTLAGLAAARARGRQGGRPKGVPARKVTLAQALYADPSHSIAEICQMLQISRTTSIAISTGPSVRNCGNA